MKEIQTEPIYRVISIITLIQVGVVVGGTLFIRVMCKFRGYADGVPDSFFNPDALFIRRSGWTLLIIPVCWAACAIFAARIELNRWFQRALIVAGLGLVLFGLYRYVTLGSNLYIL